MTPTQPDTRKEPLIASSSRMPRQPLLSRRYTLELRQEVSRARRAAIFALALAAGLALSGAILMAAGVSAGDLLDEFLVQTLFDRESLRAVLFQAAPLVLVGIAAAIAFRARFWNLGLEGQMIFGAIGATGISFYDVGPHATRLWLMLLASLICGLLWVVLPLVLKVKLGINEIISSLMLNYVAANFLLQLVYGPWQDPKDSFPHSPQFPDFALLPHLPGQISSAILFAAVVTLAAWWFTERSRAGLYLRFLHASESVAGALGVPVRHLLTGTVLLSGAVAGMSGFLIAVGQEGRLTQSFYTGYGFSGVLIAFLARNNPLGASAVAILVAVLFVSGRSLQVFYQIPFSMVQLIQAILVISVAASDFFVRHRFCPVVSERQ
ncbi:ABC transporter permease [Paraburkholderia sp. BCC1886]|uniref:ABC transporter permease n=1 Tax=Paraburkholderia sp. BCC1886 TaxID=2562670 RepID=UPI001181F247|nr:ABC transporter permease [Paraburkholderia sp. BCC1886]